METAEHEQDKSSMLHGYLKFSRNISFTDALSDEINSVYEYYSTWFLLCFGILVRKAQEFIPVLDKNVYSFDTAKKNYLPCEITCGWFQNKYR